jgi:Flp pilus assembly protein TadG
MINKWSGELLQPTPGVRKVGVPAQRQDWRRTRGKRRGLATVELAIAATFLALIFTISVDFARVFNCKMILDSCARNGALYGANLQAYQETGCVCPDDGTAAAAVAEGASLNPALTTGQVSSTTQKGTDGNNQITVTVTYSFSTFITYPGLSNPLTLTATSSMRVAN